MKKTSFILFTIIFLLVLFFIPTKVKATNNELITVHFVDNNLYSAVKEKLNKKIQLFDDSINSMVLTKTDLLNVKSLNLENKNIEDLTGIEKFVNLNYLYLANNNISNIEPVCELSKLFILNLSNNNVSDISKLSCLKELYSAGFNNNKLSDVSTLGNMPNLRILNLNNNDIRDISSFSNLTNLVILRLDENHIEDISYLDKLGKLNVLSLKNQTYDYLLSSNILVDVQANVKLPPFFLQAKQLGSLNYTKSNLFVVGATLSKDSSCMIIKNSTAGEKVATVRIVGGTADGSIMVVKYNSVLVSSTDLISSPGKIFETVGGTISFDVTVAGENAPDKVSFQIIKNSKDVTNKFRITKKNINGSTSKIFLAVPTDVSAGIYSLNICYDNRIIIRETFTIHERIDVSSIKLNTSKLTLPLSKEYKLSATVNPSNATNNQISWSSSNSSIVSVDSDGNILAKKYGIAIITAATLDGKKSANCVVTVPRPVSGVNLDLDKTTIVVNESKELTVTISPSNATNKDLVWKTDNSKVVSVTQTGIIKGISVGKATITVTTVDGNYSDKCVVTVTAPEPEIVSVQSIALNKSSLTLVEGKSETLVATILPDNATNKNVTWASTNTNVATVDSNGKVFAKAAGKAVIVVTAEDSKLGIKQAFCEVTVVSNEITSDMYEVSDSKISNIKPNCSLRELLDNLEIPVSYKVYNSKGKQIVYDTIACTGMYIELENSVCYYLVVSGDVSGDGKISASDILSLKRHLTSVKTLNGVYNDAADLNGSSSVSATDLLRMKRIAVGLVTQ